MGCYHPMHGVMCQDGRWRIWAKPRDVVRSQSVPCGQCVGCRLDRSRSWAVRCLHEASLYSRNCFITLTYAPEHLPPNSSLVYEHFQKFMKRLRFAYSGVDSISTPDGPQRPIRFYMAGEYGGERGRPHFHACLFNFDFLDKTPWLKSPSGKMLFRSAQLEELWPFGFSSIGDVNFQSAAYVARYIMKKVTGKDAHLTYETVDEYGVVDYRAPEFNKMSLKPGIGRGWFDKFSSDVFPHDYVVVNGKKCKPPRYYSTLFERSTSRLYEYTQADGVEFSKVVSSAMEDIKFAREELAKLHLDDNTPNRLSVREHIAISSLSRLKRTL